MFTRSLFTLLAATALSTAIVGPAAFSPASAQINITLGAPPPPQYEMVPVARPGYPGAPGSRDDSCAPMKAPGTDPTSSAAVTASSRSPKKM